MQFLRKSRWYVQGGIDHRGIGQWRNGVSIPSVTFTNKLLIKDINAVTTVTDAAGNLYMMGVTGTRTRGSIKLTKIPANGGAFEHFVIENEFEVDDHVTNFLYILPSGRLLCMYCTHQSTVGNNYRLSNSTTGDIMAGFTARRTVPIRASTTSTYGYSPTILSDGDTFCFAVRGQTPGYVGNWDLCETSIAAMESSLTTQAETWTRTILQTATDQRPYPSLAYLGGDVYRVISSTGNPQETTSSIVGYYAEKIAGVWRFFLGDTTTEIGHAPNVQTDCTMILASDGTSSIQNINGADVNGHVGIFALKYPGGPSTVSSATNIQLIMLRATTTDLTSFVSGVAIDNMVAQPVSGTVFAGMTPKSVDTVYISMLNSGTGFYEVQKFACDWTAFSLTYQASVSPTDGNNYVAPGKAPSAFTNIDITFRRDVSKNGYNDYECDFFAHSAIPAIPTGYTLEAETVAALARMAVNPDTVQSSYAMAYVWDKTIKILKAGGIASGSNVYSKLSVLYMAAHTEQALMLDWAGGGNRDTYNLITSWNYAGGVFTPWTGYYSTNANGAIYKTPANISALPGYSQNSFSLTVQGYNFTAAHQATVQVPVTDTLSPAHIAITFNASSGVSNGGYARMNDTVGISWTSPYKAQHCISVTRTGASAVSAATLGGVTLGSATTASVAETNPLYLGSGIAVAMGALSTAEASVVRVAFNNLTENIQRLTDSLLH